MIRYICIVMVIVGMLGTTSCSRESKKSAKSRTSADMLSELMAGNELFRSKDSGREKLITGQNPEAVVLACSDSRVSPKILFEQGLGDLFVVRVAGNVANVENIASIEYAIEHFDTSLVMVVGHDSCGAVKAAVEGVPDEGDTKNLAALVRNIRSNIASEGGSLKALPDDPHYRSQVIANVRGVIKDLMGGSSIISRAVQNGTVALVPAMYSLETGKVEVLPDQ